MKTRAPYQSNWFKKLTNIGEKAQQDQQKQDKPEAVMMQPALRQIGTTPCPVCRAKVAVFLTRTNRPFLNCGLCSVRIFFNGQESMRLLKKDLKPVTED
jgi:hypothetical protein